MSVVLDIRLDCPTSARAAKFLYQKFAGFAVRQIIIPESTMEDFDCLGPSERIGDLLGG
jgi:hypothetical protein